MRRLTVSLFGLVALFCAVIRGRNLVELLSTEFLYKKDFIQFYLTGRAFRDGVFIYTPLPELAARYAPELGSFLNHPTGYPPFAALFFLPWTFVSYKSGVAGWTIIETACLITAMILVVRHFGGRSAPITVLVTALMFTTWQPVYIDLFFSQVMLFLTLLLTLTWLAVRQGKDIQAGVYLGIALALKMYGWPLVILLFLKGRRKTALVAGGVFVASVVLGVAVFGLQAFTNYYLHVGPQIAALWQADPYNFSVIALGVRQFGSVGGVVLPIALLLAGLAAALRTQEFDAAFMIVLAVSTLLQPVAWIHYFTTLLPAVCFIAVRAAHNKALILALVLCATVPNLHYYAAVSTFAEWTPVLMVLGLILILSPAFARQPIVEAATA